MTPTLATANVALANQANMALYAAMIVFTLAMLTFAWYLAGRAPQVADSRAAAAAAPVEAERAEVLVGAGAATADSAPVQSEAVARARGLYGAGPEYQDSPRSAQRASIALMFTYLGTALLIASVVMRGLATERPPWGNMFEFSTAACAAVGLTYSVLARRFKWEWLGVFLVTPILLVLGLSLAVLYTEAGELMPALKSYWLGIHVSVAFIAMALFTIAFVMGVLYYFRGRREATPPAKPNWIESLPSSTSLERTAYSINMVAFILWTFTLIAGSIWAKNAWGAYWQWDPKEVWTFVIWVIYAAYMHSRATAGVDAMKSMWIAYAGYVAIIINYTLVNLVSTFVGMHNYSGAG